MYDRPVEGIQLNIEVKNGSIDTRVGFGSRPAEVVNDTWFRFPFFEYYSQWVGIEMVERNSIERTFASTEVLFSLYVGVDGTGMLEGCGEVGPYLYV